MDTEKLELEALISRANHLREQTPELADTQPFTTRNFHYYVSKKLIPQRGGRRGRNILYPASLVYRLLFIRHLQTIESLSLSSIREVLGQVSVETMERVALGKEPFKWGYAENFTEQELAEYAKEGQVLKVVQPQVTLPLGPYAQLVINKKITARQEKQLAHAAELIKGILASGGEG